MTTIRQMSGTINGMLESKDKSIIARNYIGALVTAFRGWMISQAGEFYKTGVDFYDYDTDADVGGYIREKFNSSKNIEVSNKLRQGGLSNKDFEGMYNFTTGTVDVGLHKSLGWTLIRHLWAFAQMLVPLAEWYSGSKYRHLRHMNTAEYHQLRNLAICTDFFALTVYLTVLAFSGYGDGDGDDDKYANYTEDELETLKELGIIEDENKLNDEEKTLVELGLADRKELLKQKKLAAAGPRSFKKGLKSLRWSSMLASISERFSQLGGHSFLLGASDIIKGVTVGTALFDDVKYLATCVHTILEDADMKEKIDDETNDILVNGSFKGKTKQQKAWAYLLADTGVDILPYLLAMDAYDAWNGQYDANNPWSDYSLNFYKSTTEAGNAGSAKWYGEEVIPASLVYKQWNENKWFNSQLGPAKKEKPKKDKDEEEEEIGSPRRRGGSRRHSRRR